MSKKTKCPRCGEDEMNENKMDNALSRRDNKTYICNPCETDEAMHDLTHTWLREQETHWLKGVATKEEA
jgi:transposase-like protein